MSKFLSQAKTSKLQLALCPITGLSITLDIPAIPNRIYTYQNPLAIPANAIGIAKLSYKDKSILPKNILAGALLCLLEHYKIIEDHLSSIERNEKLSTCSTYQLHSILFSFSSSTKQVIKQWPHLSLEEADSTYSSTTNIIQNYIDLITGKAEIEQSKYAVSSISSTKKQKKSKQVPSTLRNRMKEITAEISYLLPAKVIQVLQVVAQGNNLYSLNENLRSKLVAKLTALENIRASELADIIETANKIEDEDITQHFMESRPVKSLKDILAAKLGKTVEVKQLELPPETANTVEDLFYPTFSHRDCDSCEYDFTSCKQLGYCYHIEVESQQKEGEILGLIKDVADELGIENNLEYIEEDENESNDCDEQYDYEELADEDEESEESTECDSTQEEEGDDDEF